MVNDIITGVSRTLYKNFEGVTIYTEQVQQGFENPCFFILALKGSEDRLLGERAKKNISLDIHYFPSKKSYKELFAVADKLYGVLRRITLLNGDSINGLKLSSEIVDGVLHFFVQYKPIVYYSTGEKTENMDSLDHKIEIKE